MQQCIGAATDTEKPAISQKNLKRTDQIMMTTQADLSAQEQPARMSVAKTRSLIQQMEQDKTHFGPLQAEAYIRRTCELMLGKAADIEHDFYEGQLCLLYALYRYVVKNGREPDEMAEAICNTLDNLSDTELYTRISVCGDSAALKAWAKYFFAITPKTRTAVRAAVTSALRK